MGHSYFSSPMKNCLLLSISFSCMYSSYSTLLTLQSSLNHEANLGLVSMTVICGSILLCSTSSPLLVETFGAKRVMALAWVFFILYTAGNFYPTWATLVPTACLMGALIGPMRTCRNLYLAVTGEEYARLHIQGLPSGNDLHSALSKFAGIFYMFYHMADIGGNLLSSLVLTSGVNTNVSQTLDLDLCGANDCPWTDYSNRNSNTTEDFIEPDRDVVYILLGVLLGFNVCGLLLTIFALPPLEQDATFKLSTTCRDSISWLRMIVNPVMVPLVPLFMTEPTFFAVLAADYTKAFISCTLGVQWIGFILTTYGALAAITAFSVNHLARYLGRPVMIVSAIVLAISSFIIMLTWQPSRNDGLPMYFIVPLMAGLSQGTINAQTVAIVGNLFKDKKTEGYSVLITSKSLASTFAFVLSLFVCLRQRLVVALCIYVTAFVGYVWTELQIRRKVPYDEN